MRAVSSIAVIIALGLFIGTAAGDDWVATKLRGGVFVYVDGGWVQLKRGDTIPQNGVIRTKPNGRATFERGAETVAIGPDTQIQINDKNGGEYTTVKQWEGEVVVEAEARNVQHFEVRTPQMAAVVKGTRFTVEADGKSTEVSVQRGHVAVEDQQTHYEATISVGQSASAGEGQVLTVEGKGSTSPVMNAAGEPVPPSPGAPRGSDPSPQVASNPTSTEQATFAGSSPSPSPEPPPSISSGSNDTPVVTADDGKAEKDKKDKEEKEKKEKDDKEKKDKDK